MSGRCTTPLPVASDSQAPDMRPGRYYVTAQDAGRVAFLAGPFALHADALALVDKARDIADRVTNGRAFFWAFGTSRLPEDFASLPSGKINGDLGLVDVAGGYVAAST